jgi:hypothetical protein
MLFPIHGYGGAAHLAFAAEGLKYTDKSEYYRKKTTPKISLYAVR